MVSYHFVSRVDYGPVLVIAEPAPVGLRWFIRSGRSVDPVQSHTYKLARYDLVEFVPDFQWAPGESAPGWKYRRRRNPYDK